MCVWVHVYTESDKKKKVNTSLEMLSMYYFPKLNLITGILTQFFP